jgi:hypothetical protein
MWSSVFEAEYTEKLANITDNVNLVCRYNPRIKEILTENYDPVFLSVFEYKRKEFAEVIPYKNVVIENIDILPPKDYATMINTIAKTGIIHKCFLCSNIVDSRVYKGVNVIKFTGYVAKNVTQNDTLMTVFSKDATISELYELYQQHKISRAILFNVTRILTHANSLSCLRATVSTINSLLRSEQIVSHNKYLTVPHFLTSTYIPLTLLRPFKISKIDTTQKMRIKHVLSITDIPDYISTPKDYLFYSEIIK